MPELFLTPAAISYLCQIILALLLTGYLWHQRRRWQEPAVARHGLLLLACFGVTTGFLILLLLEASLLSGQQLIAIYLQSPTLSVVLTLLIQFAYAFPRPRDEEAAERWVALLCCGAYVVWDMGFTAWRYRQLQQGVLVARPISAEVVLIAGFIWVMLILWRNAGQRSGSTAGRRFALLFSIPLWLAGLSLANTIAPLSQTFYQINRSLGILLALFLFALSYLTALPELTSFQVKLSGVILTAVLGVFGTIGWLVAPAYAMSYRPALVEGRSLRFQPNAAGGYDVASLPGRPEAAQGEDLHLTDDAGPRPAARVAFTVDFYGQRAHEVWITNNGALGIGGPLSLSDLEHELTRTPAIFPLLVDLNPEISAGGVYLRREPERLVVSYRRLRAARHPEELYSFQLILEASGAFEITYSELPTPQRTLDDKPEPDVWAVGARPAPGPQRPSDLAQLPLSSGPEGVVADERRAFRAYMHAFLAPLAGVILLSSLIFSLGLPLLLRRSLTRPLEALLAGVRALNAGDRRVRIPVQHNDEIGFLSSSFNSLASELEGLIAGLEARVSERTAELRAANERLRKLSIAVEQSPSTIIITDLAARIEYVNAAFTHSTGYAFAEVLGRNPRLLKSNQTTPETYRELWATLKGGQIWRGELCNRRKDGAIYWEHTVIAPISDARGAITHYVAVKEDISARKRAEAALRDSEQHYRTLFDMESDAIFIMRNDDGAILEANSAAEALYGFSRAELLSMRNTDLSAEPEATRQASRAAQPPDNVVQIPLRWHRKRDGTIFPVDITARFFTWGGQSVHIATIRDITERRQAQQELERMAITDPLTGLYNRRHFYAEAERAFARARADGGALAILMLDVDYFKRINDTYGHQVGDRVLHEVAQRLGRHMRASDLLARYGGEEFVALLMRTDAEDSTHVIERLLGAIREAPIEVDGRQITISLSGGAATLGPATASLDELLGQADQALYEAKGAGRDRWACWGQGRPS